MNKLLEVVSLIKESPSFRECLLLKERMKDNKELTELIEKIKKLQKEYVRGNYQDEKIKNELKCLEQKLHLIPIYVEYERTLEEVNSNIELVKDTLNTYFDKLLNPFI